MRIPALKLKPQDIRRNCILLSSLLAMIPSATAQNTVDVGVFQSPTPNSLEIRVRPTSTHTLVVSEITFTIRWPSASGANLGVIDQTINGNSCAASTVPMVKSPDGEVTVAGFRYQTISAFGLQQLQQCSGYSWPGGVETVIARIPILNNTGCTTFHIVNDGYTAANNRDFYVSLGGEPATGVIYSPGPSIGACGGVVVQARALLDGPYNSATQLMRDDLRIRGVIPTTHPYSPAPWNHTGSETIAPDVLAVTANNAIVDWVLMELRSSTSSSTVVGRRAALIQRDGDIVDMDGTSPVTFNGVTSGNYHIVVRHRNHLGIMSAAVVPLSGTAVLIDLSTAATNTFGTNGRRSSGTARLMWGGNANENANIKYLGLLNDRQAILNLIGATTPNGTLTNLYHIADVNMNGTVNYLGINNDRQFLLNSIGATTPNITRVQQVP